MIGIWSGAACRIVRLFFSAVPAPLWWHLLCRDQTKVRDSTTMTANLRSTILALLNPQYAILNAQTEFEQSQIKITNPSLINDEFSHQREIFSKLKFIYLEQETRDKFLRRISELTTIENIESGDVQLVSEQSLVKKSELKALKNELDEQLIQFKNITQENNDLYKEYETRLEKNNLLLDELSRLDDEVEKALQDSKDYYEIFDNLPGTTAKETSGGDESKISEEIQLMISTKENELQKTLLELDSLTKNVETKASLAQSQQKLNEQSLDMLTHLKAQKVEDGAPISDDFQRYCIWCKEINEILIKFTDISNMELKQLGQDKFKLVLLFVDDQIVLIYGGGFKILKINKDIDLEEFNGKFLDEDLFGRELARIISKRPAEKS